MSSGYCVACDNVGCERCSGGPGEQGFSLDEKELLELRNRVHALEREKHQTWDRAIERAAAVVDAAVIVPGLAASVRALKGTA